MSMPSRSSTSDHFFEDFEGYSYGQYLNDSGKWTYHNDYDFGKATAIANPFSSLTPKCGRNSNPSSGQTEQGILLSPIVDITKGTLELWMATSKIDSTDRTTTTVYLFGTTSDSPSLSDERLLKIGFNQGAICYYNNDQGPITGFVVSPEIWYHLEVRFDCLVKKCDITITGSDGTLKGMVQDVGLMGGLTSLRRIGLATGAMIDGKTMVSYWDDLIIESADYRIIETDGRGGSLFDGFNDLSRVSELSNLTHLQTGGLMSRTYGILDDFESYSDGESIIGKNGWRFHTSFNKGLITADRSKPFSAVTPTILKQYCNDATTGSEILSKELFLTKGTIDFWMASNYKEPTDHSATEFFLWGMYKDNPVLSERLLAIVYAYNDIKVINGGFKTLISSISTNTWYHIRIELDLVGKVVSVYGMDAQGTLLGSLINISLEHDYPMCKMLGLIAGKKTGGTYIKSYWDDITINEGGLYGIGTVESIPFELPQNCDWTNLRVDKKEVGGSEVSIRILDASTMKNAGLFFNNRSSEIDISGLNALGVRSIVLNATLRPSVRDPAVLLGWGVEWERKEAFRDSFLTSRRLSSKEKTVAEIGHIRMMDGRFEGQVMSTQLDLPDPALVPALFLDTPLEGPTSINAYLVIQENKTKVGTPIDMGNGTYLFHSVDRSKGSRVMLVMDIRSAIRGPVLRSWSLVGLPNNAPEVLGLIAPPTVNRTQEVRIAVTVNDLDQPRSMLKVELRYLPPGGTVWETGCIRSNGFIMATGGWDFTFYPTRTTPVGPFSMKVRATDEHGSIVEKVYKDIINVVNNRPTRPDIALFPTIPQTDTVIEASILNLSHDVETDILLYTFEWYVNGAFEHREENLSLTSGSELPGSRFMKHDIVRCEVFSFDGLDRSDRGFAEVEILNSPPRGVEPFLKWIEYNEDEPDLDGFDLSRWVFDPDSDRLTYHIEGFHEIEMSVDDEGVLWVETRKDWFGNETVTVSVADQESRVIFDLTIIVRPMNDMPVLESIEYEGVEAFPLIGDIPDSFDSDGRPVSWSKGRRVDIRFPEERIVPLKVKAKDIETGRMSYSLRPSTDVPFAIVQDTVSGSIFTLIPDRDAFGEYWVRLDVDDDDGGIVTAWVRINITNVNDPPTGFIVIPSDSKAWGESGTNITFSARVQDVDGDVLIVTWSSEGDVLATGETVNIKWMVPGNYDLECVVTDGLVQVPLGFVEVNVTAKPIVPIKDPVKKEFPLLLVVIAAVLLLIVLGVATFFMKRSMSMTKELKVQEEAQAQKILPTLVPSETPADGRMLSLGLGSPILPGASPSLTGSMIKPASEKLGDGGPVVTGELPPASIEMTVKDQRDVYIRPSAAPQRSAVASGMMSAPVISTQMTSLAGPVQMDGANLTPVPDIQDDMMKVGLSEGPPQVEETVFHDSEDHVWTPAMAESRAATESKGAVDLLRELNELKEKGALSEEEFDVSKRRLLRKI